MDATKFRPRMLLDTGVVIRALEHDDPKHKDDQRTRDCRALWVAVLAGDSQASFLVAAPSVYEFSAGAKVNPIPTSRHVEYVSMTHIVAMDMAKWAPKDQIAKLVKAGDVARRPLSWDAQIVACARAQKASFVVTLDAHVTKLCKHASITCVSPGYFRKAARGQEILPHVPNVPL